MNDKLKARRLKYIGDLTKEKLKGMHLKLGPDGQWTSLDPNQLLRYFLAWISSKVIGNVICSTVFFRVYDGVRCNRNKSQKKVQKSR